jgi:hypothetical protein
MHEYIPEKNSIQTGEGKSLQFFVVVVGEHREIILVVSTNTHTHTQKERKNDEICFGFPLIHFRNKIRVCKPIVNQYTHTHINIHTKRESERERSENLNQPFILQGRIEVPLLYYYYYYWLVLVSLMTKQC